jgi:ribosome recycling factor
MEKNKEISEDDLKRCQEEIQKDTDNNIGNIEEIFKAKEKEILEI